MGQARHVAWAMQCLVEPRLAALSPRCKAMQPAIYYRCVCECQRLGVETNGQASSIWSRNVIHWVGKELAYRG